MAKQLQKLELTWIGKGKEPKLEPRILIEDPAKSYGDPNSENMLIHGDNLLALKALEQNYAGRVKCVYIDPPYNTGSAFEHYDDGIEHSLWLNLMKPRLELLRSMLTDDGCIWISIDDDECHYLKLLCDEVFGRKNFVCSVIWQKKYSPQNDARWLSDNHDYILVYAKNKEKWRPNLLPRGEKQNKMYKYNDNDGRGVWRSDNLLRKDIQKSGLYTITTPSGRKCDPPFGTSWRIPEYKYQELLAQNKIYFGKNGDGVPSLKRYLNEVKDGVTSLTIWTYDEVGHTQDAKREVFAFNREDPFETPKPEKLIERIIHMGSNEGDLVLDSFLGSGTTAAVAHKMNRKWIGVELGNQAFSHCLPRLQRVVSGEDKGGITVKANWSGGGGFKFYTLASSLLQKDKYGNDVINPDYNANMLAAAMAKQEGFQYAPDESIYWKQGKSSEKDFILTTTQFITVEMLDKLHDEMKPDESLLICCKSFKKECERRHSNITIKKIPQMLLGRCEFGKDDYSLNIINLPHEDQEQQEESIQQIETVEAVVKKAVAKSKKPGRSAGGKKGSEEQPELF